MVLEAVTKLVSENLTSTGCSWYSEASTHFCHSRWSRTRYRNQAAEVYLHSGRVSAEAQRDEESAEESPPAGDNFLWERHRQRHHCTSQADVRELLSSSCSLAVTTLWLWDCLDWKG